MTFGKIPLEETPEYRAEVERVASQPQFCVTVDTPDGEKHQLYLADLDWTVVERWWQLKQLKQVVRDG